MASALFFAHDLECVEGRRHRGAKSAFGGGKVSRVARGEQIGDRREHGEGDFGSGGEVVAQLDERSVGIGGALFVERGRREDRALGAHPMSQRPRDKRRAHFALDHRRELTNLAGHPYAHIEVLAVDGADLDHDAPLAEWRAAQAEASHATHGSRQTSFEELPHECRWWGRCRLPI